MLREHASHSLTRDALRKHPAAPHTRRPSNLLVALRDLACEPSALESGQAEAAVLKRATGSSASIRLTRSL